MPDDIDPDVQMVLLTSDNGRKERVGSSVCVHLTFILVILPDISIVAQEDTTI